MSARKRATRSSRVPTQAEIWPRWDIGPATVRRGEGGRFVSLRVAALDRAIRAAGQRMLAFRFEDLTADKRANPLLAALDAAPAVRRQVGRLDISGATDAACFAQLVEDGAKATLTLTYRHGLEALRTIAGAAEDLAAALGWRVSARGPRFERDARYGPGAHRAVLALSARAGVAA